MTTEPIKWGPVKRAWLLIRVESTDRVGIATHIYNQMNERYADIDTISVVRADVVSGPYDLIAPVFTETDDELKELIDRISKIEGVIEVVPALVTNHLPSPPHNAPGYVSDVEANPVNAGPTRHNPW